jgi:hypothetical protein
MDQFRTTFPVPFSKTKITYQTPVMFMGSCFSEYIGNKLSDCKFIVDNNPFGIMYNPMSVKTGIMRLIDSKIYTKEELFKHEGIWGSFDHHSRFSDSNQDNCLRNINSRIEESSKCLRNARFLFITFGTAYVYSHKANHKIVSNCHKFPASVFARSRLSIDEIVSEYNAVLQELHRINPALEVIFTVSPIRHWKDGAHDNQLSKSILLLAIEQICSMHKQASYFPSYELMMDDLRDYRFYDEDMLHPNKIAINYIWEHVRDCFIDKDVAGIMKEVEKVIQAARHRPFNPKSEPYQAFVQQTLDKITYLKEQYGIEFLEEEKALRSNG